MCLLLAAPGSWWDLCSPALSSEKHQVLTPELPGSFLFSSLLKTVHILTASNKLPSPSVYWNCSLENTKNQNATNQVFSWSSCSPSLQSSWVLPFRCVSCKPHLAVFCFYSILRCSGHLNLLFLLMYFFHLGLWFLFRILFAFVFAISPIIRKLM